MIFFIALNLSILICIVLLLLVLSAIWPPDSPWAPWWNVKKETAKAICKIAKITKKDVVYDLGCGDGTSLITAAKEYGATCIGIEIDPLRALIAKVKVHQSGMDGKIIIKRKNFFQEDIRNGNVVFVYLVPKALARLLPKLKKELKPGTRIVSYRYEIDLPLKAYDKKHQLRLYIR